MRYFQILTMGKHTDKKLAFIDSVPEGMGLNYYKISRGERIGDDYPAEPKIFLKPHLPGIQLSSLLGNTQCCLIINQAMKDVVLEHCEAKDLEVLPFTLFNHKKRVQSNDYSIVNPIGYMDCLNRSASDITYLSTNPNKIVAINKFVFDPRKIKAGVHLFRIEESKGRYFISQKLAKAFQDHKFTNVYLDEIKLIES